MDIGVGKSERSQSQEKDGIHLLLASLLFVFTFMQCDYNYVHMANRMSRVYNVAAIL